MLSKLVTLATQTDSDSRRDLLRSIAGMFYSEERDHVAESEARLFAQVVIRVLADVGESGRAAFAKDVAADHRTPRDLAVALANDEEVAVAAPVVQQSKALTDDDLIAIANARTTDHRIAIAQRPGVGERVTDALVDHDETDVMMTILDNETARPSERALNRMADRAEDEAGICERLCIREDTPHTVLRRLLPQLAADDKQDIEARLAAGEDHLRKAVTEANSALASERAERARRRFEVRALARRVLAGDMKLSTFVDTVAGRGRPIDAAQGLAMIAKLPEGHVVTAMMSASAEPIAIVCKGLQMAPELYRDIETMRRQAMGQTADVPLSTMDEYRRLTVASAQRALRFVRVHANVSAG